MKLTGIEEIKQAMEKFKGNGGERIPFFDSLKNDGDSCLVRFLHKGEDDLNVYVVHKVKINDKDRWVECTGDETCPLCMAGSRPQLKMFLLLVDRTDGQIKLWERGQKFIPTMINLIKEYGNLDERDYKIVRNGAKGDTATTYTLFNRDKEAQELPERPEVSGENNFVLHKSLDVMEQIARGTYVPAQDTASSTRSATDLF
jgi:hypothetical protein